MKPAPVGWHLAIALAALAASAAEPPVPADLAAADPMVVERVELALAEVRGAPANAAGWAELAMTLHAHDWSDGAIRCYQQALQLDGDRPRWWHDLARAKAELGDLEGALAASERASRLAATYAPAFWQRGLWLLDLGRLEAAGSAFREALRIVPADPAATAGLARVLLLENRSQAAADLLEGYLAGRPRDGHARQLLGAAYRSLGRIDEARQQLARGAGARAPVPDPWYQEVRRLRTGRGNILRDATELLQQGRPAEAIPPLEELLRRQPADPLVLNKLGEAYLIMGRGDRALEVFEAARELAPDDFATYLHLAQADGLLGRDQRALAHAARALALNPSHWPSHYEHGKILHRLGRLEEAVTAYETALRHGAHEHFQALALLAECQYRLARWPAAAASFERLVERFPHVATGFAGLAAVWSELGRLEEARQALERARELDPRAPNLRPIATRLRQLEAARQATHPEGQGG